jgi:hypothetical protein
VERELEAQVEVEIQTELEDHRAETGDHREDDAEDEDFGPKEEREGFEMEVETRLEVEAEAEGEKERMAIGEREQGSQIPEASKTSRIHFDVHVIDEVREKETEARIEAKIGEIINATDADEGNDDQISDFFT